MKQKRENKTKEQLLQEMEIKKEVSRMRSKVKNEFYPLLCSHSENIDEAKVFCQAVSIAIEQAFNNKQKEIKVGELGLIEMLKSDNDETVRWKMFLNMFADETLVNAQKMIRELPNAIDGFIREEMSGRKLETLKADFLD